MNAGKVALMVCVAASCGGCITETKSVPVSPETMSSLKGIKEADYPQREAQPATWVAVGQLQQAKANEPQVSPADRAAQRDEARKAYQKAMELDSKFVPAYVSLAGLYLQEDRLDRAIETYQRALQHSPKSAQLWYNQGEIYRKDKNTNKALESLAKAHELEPENYRYANQYGLCLAWANRPQEAFTVLSRVMNKAEANYNVARMMDVLQQPQLSRQYTQKALDERPAHAGALALLADLNSQVAAAANVQTDSTDQTVTLNPPQ